MKKAKIQISKAIDRKSLLDIDIIQAYIKEHPLDITHWRCTLKPPIKLPSNQTVKKISDKERGDYYVIISK